jgi:glycine oxidase
MKAAIVGGGLIGLGIAMEAIARGCAIDVIDSGLGFAAYRASAGMLALPSEAQALEPELLDLARDSQQRYPDFVHKIETASGVPCHLSSGGALYVALHRDQVAAMEHLAEAQARLGITTERLTGQEAREREPHLSPGVLAGLFARDERQIDPRRLRAALQAAVAALGGRFVVGEVTALLGTRDHVYGVEVAREAATHCFEYDQIVVAAGAWSRRLPVPLLGEVSLRPVKGLTLRCKGERLARHVIRSPDVYLVPMTDEELLIGASVEEVGFDASTNLGELMALAVSAARVLPGVRELQLVEASVGFRPVLRDGLPALGPTRIRGLHLAIGHSRHGVSLLPGTAVAVAQGLVQGDLGTHDRRLSSRRLEGMQA